MKTIFSLLAFILLHSFSASAETNTTNTTDTTTGGCPCLFDGDDADDCIVYGALDGDLKAWPKVEQDCLDAYSIKIDAPDPSLVCGSANSFVNGLKNGALSNSPAKFGLGIPYGGFWEESDMNADIPVLKDSITIDGNTYDCEASESNCYNAMKPYFESDSEGMKEMQDVCDTMEGAVRVARELEQSILRTRICQETRESASILSSCSDIYDEMESDLETYSSLNCGGFGFGPGGRDLPDCGEAFNSTSAGVATGRGGTLAWGLACASANYLAFA
jgi:hypothetical protein